MIESKIEGQDKIAVQAIPDRYVKIKDREQTSMKKRYFIIKNFIDEDEE